MNQYGNLNQYDYTNQCGGSVTRLYEIKAVRAMDIVQYMGSSIILGGSMQPVTVVNRTFPNSVGLPRIGIEINGIEFPEDAAILIAIEHKPEPPKPTPKPAELSDSQIIREAKKVAQGRYQAADSDSTEEHLWGTVLSMLSVITSEGYE
jgi:hypothetical protein